MAYYNPSTNKFYYGGSITITNNGVLFSGIPTSEQLTEWGFVEYIPPTPPPPPEPSDDDELDPYEALNIITGGIENE